MSSIQKPDLCVVLIGETRKVWLKCRKISAKDWFWLLIKAERRERKKPYSRIEKASTVLLIESKYFSWAACHDRKDSQEMLRTAMDLKERSIKHLLRHPKRADVFNRVAVKQVNIGFQLQTNCFYEQANLCRKTTQCASRAKPFLELCSTATTKPFTIAILCNNILMCLAVDLKMFEDW